MKKFYYLFCLLLLIGCAGKREKQEIAEPETTAIPPRIEYGLIVDSLNRVEGTIQNGQSLGTLFNTLGAGRQSIHQLSTIHDTVFNVRSLRAGKPYYAYYSNDSAAVLHHFVYIESPTDYIVFTLPDSLTAQRGKKEIHKEMRSAQATIKTSLWNAVVGAGLDMQLALKLSDIYAWNIDFFGLQAQDSFTVYYEELFVDTQSIGIGNIHAAIFTHAGKPFHAYYYAYDDKQGYWDEQGNSLKKAFLKAPLQFSRISSHFSYARKHPVHKTIRAHTGVDYAAPSGTPVMSIGDGVVIERAYKGGGGNTVKIRHNGTYTTAYLHLSKFGPGISVGTHVKQGQVIGYVGNTGTSTGPHLDFRVWQNGQPINPLKLESPPVEPIPEMQQAAFDSVRQQLYHQLLP